MRPKLRFVHWVGYYFVIYLFIHGFATLIFSNYIKTSNEPSPSALGSFDSLFYLQSFALPLVRFLLM